MKPSRRTAAALSVLAAVLALGACDRIAGKLPAKLAAIGAAPFDTDRLESAIDSSFGGIGTCVVIAETGSGRQLYRYNSPSACMRRLPPCATFEIANDLIGLDAGAVTPQTVFKWDHTPQPVTGWERDTDLQTAFKGSIVWWDQRLAGLIGTAAYRQRLPALGYGNGSPDGPPAGFWQGPSAGGGLAISTLEQAGFLHRFYAGRLAVKPQSVAALEQLMTDETRGDAVMSGKASDCASTADGSRQTGWWIGRLTSPKHDYVFAASMDAQSDSSLPGVEIERRVKTAFADAGLWPQG